MARTSSKSKPPPPPANDISDKPLAEALSERYLAYALSTITARSLPDVRDGLKPVHRRLLYAMRELRLEPGAQPKKSARVVGDVIGKFHPHGDTAVYDALVRLAQDFSQRYPLIEGQGNFGNIDGDNAAAMRYTEARLTEVARLLLEGIDENAVDFRATYDGSGLEPLILPAAFPNLLANGANGIAVGMATSIPPHNVAELCDALIHLIKFPNAGIEKLVSHIPGPDFPTGGVLVEAAEQILEAYKTGRGAFRLRARWNTEELRQGQWQIVVTEIPYQVPKSRLIEKIATLITDKKLPLVEDIRDESADDIRLILVPKSRNVDPAVMMESLFRASELESRVSLNMNVLDKNGVPQVMDLRAALRSYLEHRMDVLVRRSQHRLDQIEGRLEILGGLLIVYLNLDEVIRIIRREDEPKPKLITRFKLTETQAEAILNMRLRNLRKLEEMEIRREEKDLGAEQKRLKSLLKNENDRWMLIGDQIKELKTTFGPKTALGKRRTDIGAPPPEIAVPIEAVIEREPVTIFCSDKGWIRTQKGHVSGDKALREAVKYKEGDSERFVLDAETTDKLILFASNGRAYTVAVDKLPGGRGFGDPLRLMVELPQDADILSLHIHKADARYLIASDDGRGFIAKSDDLLGQTKNGRVVLVVGEGTKAAACTLVTGDHVAVIGSNRKLLIFPLHEVPDMAKGRGVILQRYKDGTLSDAKCFSLKQGLTWTSGGKEKTETNLRDWVGDRAQAGRMPPHGFNRNNRFSS